MPPPTAPRWRARNCSRCRSHGEVQARREPALSSAAILTSVGHDVDTVTDEGLAGAPDRPGRAAAIKAVSDLATLTDPDSLAGAVAVLQRGLLRIRHP